MFTITDEDRKLRKEGKSWKAKCENNLYQDQNQFPVETWSSKREEEILMKSLGAILQERTALLRFIYRKGESRLHPRVAVTVSQRAVAEAMANTRMKVINEQNVRKLIYHYISEDIEISNLSVNFQGGNGGLTMRGHAYTSFFLIIRD